MTDTTNQKKPEYVKVDSIENAIEGQLISSILTEREIPHQIRSFNDIAFNGLFQSQKGWGKIMAPSLYKDEILEIISDVRAQKFKA